MSKKKVKVAILSRAHIQILAVLWFGATILTAMVCSLGMDHTSGRLGEIVLVTALTITGPMTGAIARNFQSCCLECSLTLLSVAGTILAIAMAVQSLWHPRTLGRQFVRMGFWFVACFTWFFGGLLSLAHAFS